MKKNIILFVGNIFSQTIEAIRKHEQDTGLTYRIAVLYDAKQKSDTKKAIPPGVDIILSCDTTVSISLQKTLLPYINEIFAITARGEFHVPLLAKVIPHVPYLKNPTSESLIWATDKLMMRRRMYTYNKKICPRYMIITNTSQTSLKKIEQTVGFPLIAKPTGLAASKFVSICFHKEELEQVLRRTFRHMGTESKKAKKEQKVLIEQFMEGDMYSVDAYVTNRGKVYFCPMVHIKTGKSIGFDDFFGYQQLTPTLLKKESILKAREVSKDAIHALALRSSTVHIELMRFEEKWKIIELSPRIGGFRHSMYEYSYGINHSMNDILIHAGEKPILPLKRKGHTVAMKFFAPKEGKLTKLNGIKKAQELESFKTITIKKKIGDYCLYAKHGGGSVFDIIMYNEERSKLLADIRRLEKTVIIETKKK